MFLSSRLAALRAQDLTDSADKCAMSQKTSWPHRVIGAGLLCAWVTLAAGADFAQGVAAYKGADYATALAVFNDCAQHGDARAQLSLGLMYDNGEGVVADPKRAL